MTPMTEALAGGSRHAAASQRRPGRHPTRGTSLVTATVTYERELLHMGWAAYQRIEAGRGTPGDHDLVAEAFAELVSHLAVT